MEILNEHKVKYLSRRVTEIEELKTSLAQDNFEAVVSIGHRLKGNGETFGFPKITTLGSLMEKAAKDRDKEKIKECIEELQSSVEDSLKSLQ